jgi:hypothetical protein
MTSENYNYYYVIVHKKTHRMLLKDAQLPIFWQMKVAQNALKPWEDDYKVIKIDACRLNSLLNPKRPAKNPKKVSGIINLPDNYQPKVI